MRRVTVFCLLAALALQPMGAQAKPHRAPVSAQAPARFTYQPIVVAAEPEAAQAGMEVLKRGGTAADAAVAVQAVLGLIEPQSSGLGGGAFMMYYDASTRLITDYNGRETAPAGATPDMFLGPDGKALPFPAAVTSGRATGVPGAVFMLDGVQKEHGRLAWSGLFTAAEALADKGFVVTPRLGNYLQNLDFGQKKTPDAIAYFGDGKGGYRKTGDVLKNRAYGDTLRMLAAHRSDALHSGPLAAAIVAKTHAEPLPGTMTLGDLKAYRVRATTSPVYGATDTRVAKPLCAPYRVYIVCTTNAPSGGPALLQGLRMAENLPFATWGVHDPRGWQALIEVERRMYADRDQYVADTAIFAAQTDAYLDAGYARGRAETITIGTANAAPKAGDLGKAGKDATLEPGGTSHFVIRDGYGNVLSMTTTVENIFGTGRMVGGFFLNNQLTDFSFSPATAEGLPIANAVAPGKHPRSSMAPVMVFNQSGQPVMAIGSPGGNSILSYNLKAVIGVLDWGLSVQDAINLPNVVARGENIRVEKARMEPAVWDGLTSMGYKLTAVSGEESGLNGYRVLADGTLDAGSDPRREGVAVMGQKP